MGWFAIGNWKNQVQAENGAGEDGGAGEGGGAEVVRYCISKLPYKMECDGKRAESSAQGRRFLPPFHRYIDNNS